MEEERNGSKWQPATSLRVLLIALALSSLFGIYLFVGCPGSVFGTFTIRCDWRDRHVHSLEVCEYMSRKKVQLDPLSSLAVRLMAGRKAAEVLNRLGSIETEAEIDVRVFGNVFPCRMELLSTEFSNPLAPNLKPRFISSRTSTSTGQASSPAACKKDCSVRFVYNPPISQDNIVMPVILRQASKGDSHYGKWSTLVPEGITQWISPTEMEGVIEALQKLGLEWDMSRNPISFSRKAVKPPPPFPNFRWKLPMARREGTMEIDVNTGAGSFIADLPSKDVCSAMKRLDPVFRISIATYNFRGMRVVWGCKVPGYNPANRPEPPKAN
jgi:hypothetical protein